MWYLFGVFKSINLNQEHLKLTMWFILIWGRKSRKCCNFAKIRNKRILNVHHIWLADDHEGTSNLDWRTQQRSHWNQSYWKLQYSLYTVVLNENYFLKKITYAELIHCSHFHWFVDCSNFDPSLCNSSQSDLKNKIKSPKLRDALGFQGLIDSGFQ